MRTEIKTIEELFKEYKENGFSIPYYQRGYRWRAKNINELIDDIDGSKEREKGYCLQPIVINNRIENGKAHIDIVDGQQRLTSIALMRKALDIDDGEIYKSLACNDKTVIDAYFLKEANDAIKSSIEDKSYFKKKLEKSFFIVCTLEASQEEAENVFLRLNTGKIPLSSAEIFKSYCLTEYEEGCKAMSFLHTWNSIESSLQDDDFYYFFSHDDMNKSIRYYSTRMDWLLEVLAVVSLGTSEEDIQKGYEQNPNYIFIEFSKRIGKDGGPENFILEMKRTFDKLKEVYSDVRLYNLFGYLSCCTGQKGVLSVCASAVKSELSVKFNGIVADRKHLEGLEYSKDNKEIKKVLLLHNAFKSLEKNIRFNYNAYRNGEYDLEHIHARAELKTSKDVKEFLEAVKEEFSDGSTWNNHEEFFKDFESFCKKCCEGNDADNLHTDKPLELQDGQLERYESCIWALQVGGEVRKKEKNIWYGIMPDGQEDPDEWRMTSIRNLCLLQSSINRSISNYGFSEKRKRVTTQIYSSRSELPVTTAMIFNVVTPNDYHTENASLWTRQMGDTYFDDIASTLERGKKEYGKE